MENNDGMPSIEAVGESLGLFAQQLENLRLEEEYLIAKRDLMYRKMAICYDALRESYINLTGQEPEVVEHQKFPDLNRESL